MNRCRKIFILFQLIALQAVLPQQQADMLQTLPLNQDGTIPVWLMNGPFEIQTVGFGQLSDQKVINEPVVKAEYLLDEKNPSVKEGRTPWQFLSAGDNGYTDIKEYYGWRTFNTPEKIWYEKAAYAFTNIYSAKQQSVNLKFGGNTVIQIALNGEAVYKSLKTVNAQKDNFTQAVTLKKGINTLLLKVANSHENHALSFFVPINYEWGFYLRLTGLNNEALSDISIPLNISNVKTGFDITPTYFYKKAGGILKQKYLVEITSAKKEMTDGEISFKIGNTAYNIPLKDIKFGLNEKEFYIPEPKNPEKITASLKLAESSQAPKEKSFVLKPMPKYSLYFMPSTHMDIGYTNPQPIVIERQLNTLDQVLDKCTSDTSFRWTIETIWLLENFRQSRSKEKFDRLIGFIKSGRIAVSPLYSNPFTGWVSENEMLESFSWAQQYKENYGIDYFGAVYNDVPGQSWALPQALKKAGVKVLVDGINEIFSDYKYQRNLPKVFNWLGSSSDTLMLYLTEAYTEGSRYGLENDIPAIENRIWHRISNLQERGYSLNKILISGVFTDNAGIAFKQYENALAWNKTYEYPKFIISTLNDFCRELVKEKQDSLKTIKGDWTSDWDILYQGETKRMLKYRWIQNNLPSAEILSTLSGLNDHGSNSFADKISSVYKDLLNFSGHGSGLEYGYGSKFENKLTDDYREGYVQDAYLNTRELLERTKYRLTVSKESFDSHGIIVFNTLSWDRSIPVEIELPETDLNNYSVIDLSDKSSLSSFRNNDKLYFMALNVPGIGFRQYELKNIAEMVSDNKDNSGFIENEYYRISLSENGLTVIDKSTGENILKSDGIGAASFMPVRKRFQLNEDFTPFTENLKLTATEKNGVFEEMTASYHNDIFRQISFRLWKKLNRIDVTLTVNLGALKETKNTEEYGLPFALNGAGSNVLFESLGGFTKMSDRFKGAGHQYFSIRRTIDLQGQKNRFVIASPDCRIFMLDTVKNSHALIANLVNNFPQSWNRNEDKDGIINFNFSLAKVNTKNFDAAAFGYEASADAQARRSWYKKEEPIKQFIKFSNPVVKLVSLRPSGEDDNTYQMVLQNSSPVEKQSLQITSEYLFNKAVVTEVGLTGKTVSDIPVKDNCIKIEMFPNSIKKIMVKCYRH